MSRELHTVNAGSWVNVTRFHKGGGVTRWSGICQSFRPSEASYGGHNLHLVDAEGHHLHLWVGADDTDTTVVSAVQSAQRWESGVWRRTDVFHDGSHGSLSPLWSAGPLDRSPYTPSSAYVSGCGWCYLNAAHTIDAHNARVAADCQLGLHVDVLA